MFVRDPADSHSRGMRLIATLMVVLGAYGAFTALVSPIGPEPIPPILWLAGGIAALGTALAGVRLLQGRPGAATLGAVTVSAWLVVTVAQAAILGVTEYANPFTVAQTVVLVIALIALLRH